MGGAKRAERRRKRQALSSTGSSGRSRPSTSSPGARTGGETNRNFIIGAVVVLLVVVVVGGVLWQRARSDPGSPELIAVDAEYPVRLADGVVVAGEDDAEVTVDIYEDFLCPACADFEQRDGDRIREAIAGGEVQVRYHVVNILDEQSNPAGYSTDAGNAALCAADAGEFPGYHASLLGKPPREGGRGYSIDQLVELGVELGITDAAFEPCVRDGEHDQIVHDQKESASSDEDLIRTFPDGRKGFATPTVVIDGDIMDIGDSAWLDRLAP